MKSFAKSISKDQSKDTGMVVVLLLLLLGYFNKNTTFYLLSIVLLLIDMIVPVIFTPVAFIWLGFSKVLGNITSKIILTVIFYIIVWPIAILRKTMGKDSLQLKNFKKSDGSTFVERNYTYKAADLEKPY
ncbi:MAG: SxtJ family membrane protein [Ignavibacteriales bacterium]|nr:SxtJ family membrane protein [Ignavibacteriales bacterium]